jgi:hypothetical protein
VKGLLKQFILSGCIAALLSCTTGCIGPHYSQHNILVSGKLAPPIRGPRDPAIVTNLTTNLWAKSPLPDRAAEVGVTWAKSAGIQGWKDYHMHAKVVGTVMQHEFSSNGFLTMDLRLNSLTVKRIPIHFNGTRYIRLEIYLGKVSVAAAVYERTNVLVVAQGKLVWDSDGWFEIHPQKTGDVELIPPIDLGPQPASLFPRTLATSQSFH